MRKRRFSEVERAAVFKAHNGRCHVCGKPCTLSEMQIDHVIPESIAENPDKLMRVRELFALPDDFEVNAFENWAPAHSSCNRTKAEIIYVPSLVVQQVIEKARRLGPEARKFSEKALSDREIERAKSTLMQAREKGQLSDEDFKSFTSDLLSYTDGEGQRLLNWEFLIGIITNATLMRTEFYFDFIANGVEINIKVEIRNGTPAISLTAKKRQIMLISDYFKADVEFEIAVSTEHETMMFAKFNNLYFNLPGIKFLGEIEQKANYTAPPEFKIFDNTD